MSKKLGTIKTTVNGATVSPKAVAEKATNVAKKATEQVSKPSIKSLQQEVVNLTEQLVYANKLSIALGDDVNNLKDDNKALEREVVMLNASIRHRDEVILKLEVPFYRKIFNLFGS